MADGDESLGSLGGLNLGGDRMQLSVVDIDAHDYVFAEIGGAISSGDTAGIGFWQNKHGQTLIAAGGFALADWLSSEFSNVFGNRLLGASGQEVGDFYRNELFRSKSKKSTGPAHVDAQFMALAMAGDAFLVDDNTGLTILRLLRATNWMTDEDNATSAFATIPCQQAAPWIR